MAKKEKEDIKAPVYFPTGHTLMDLVVGAGDKAGYGMGYPAGTICRDHGDTGSFKSFKATELIAAGYHKFKDKFRWYYCDPEYGNTIDTVALYGFDMFPKPKKPEREVVTVEDWDYSLNKWLDTLHPEEGEVGIYVLDSLDSITDAATVARKEKRRGAYDKDKEFDEGSYAMTMQKFLSQEFFRGLTAKLTEKNALLYIISQERDNVGAGMYAPKNKTSGGRALTFYETVKIVSKLRAKDEAKDRVISAIAQITAEKTRHPYPFRNCLVTLHFTYGVDSMSDEIDFLFDLRTKDKCELKARVCESIIWDEGMEPMTREELLKYIPENKLRKELKRRVIEKWEAIEESIKVVRPPKYEED